MPRYSRQLTKEPHRVFPAHVLARRVWAVSRESASGKELQVVPSVDCRIKEKCPCHIKRDAQDERCDGEAAHPKERGKNENERRNHSDNGQRELRRRETLASARRGALVLACQPVDCATDQYRETRAAKEDERRNYR